MKFDRHSIARALVRLAARIAGPNVSTSISYKHPEGWAYDVPGRTGTRLADRGIQYGGQLAGIAAAGTADTFGLTKGLPGLSPWLIRLMEGLAGDRPSLPRLPWWRRWLRWHA